MAKLRVHSSGSGIVNNIDVTGLQYWRKVLIISIVTNVVLFGTIIAGVVYVINKGL